MTTGNPVAANKAAEWSLVDHVVDGDLLPQAIAYAEKLEEGES
jgi:enoyl-CoA hydratase/carnithine racemase